MVLIACEYSGRVRDALVRSGVKAVSCDLLPSESPGSHIQDDVQKVLKLKCWTAVIAFPPCTDLCASGARWFPEKIASGEQEKSIEFFLQFTRLSCPWAIENPVGIMSEKFRKPNQIIQPWQFGHGETKATCLWLNKLSKLIHTSIVSGRENKVHRLPPSKDRAKLRSLTYSGIAEAMAVQWANWLQIAEVL